MPARQGWLVADELDIVIETFRRDHGTQDVVRGQNANLAFDLGNVGIGRLRTRDRAIVDHPEIARVDEQFDERPCIGA